MRVVSVTVARMVAIGYVDTRLYSGVIWLE